MSDMTKHTPREFDVAGVVVGTYHNSVEIRPRKKLFSSPPTPKFPDTLPAPPPSLLRRPPLPGRFNKRPPPSSRVGLPLLLPPEQKKIKNIRNVHQDKVRQDYPTTICPETSWGQKKAHKLLTHKLFLPPLVPGIVSWRNWIYPWDKLGFHCVEKGKDLGLSLG